MSNSSITCPACDGDGSLSAQMTKERWLSLGSGSVKRVLKQGTTSYYQNIYYDKDGKELEFKTIGGPCSVCGGKKVVEKMSLEYQTIPEGEKLDYSMIGVPITADVLVDSSITGIVVLTNPLDGTKIAVTMPGAAELMVCLQRALDSKGFKLLP